MDLRTSPMPPMVPMPMVLPSHSTAPGDCATSRRLPLGPIEGAFAKSARSLGSRSARLGWAVRLFDPRVEIGRARSIVHLTLRLTADVFPRFSSSSYSICCPSLSAVSPARSTAEMWTNTSLPPACGWMNSVALRRIEPLHGAARHFDLPSDDPGCCYSDRRLGRQGDDRVVHSCISMWRRLRAVAEAALDGFLGRGDAHSATS